MAEYMLRYRIQDNAGLKAGSAGIATMAGMQASSAAIEVMREWNIDLSPHRSRQVQPYLMESFTRIIVMTPEHEQQLALNFPEFNSKVSVLTSYGGTSGRNGISDPIGMSVQAYREIRNQIWDAIEGLVRHSGGQGPQKTDKGY